MNKWKQWHLIWLDHQDSNGPTCNHSAAASPGEQGNGPRQPQLLGPSPVMIAPHWVAENYYYHNGVFSFPWYPARLLSASTYFIFQKQKHVFLSLPACVLFVRMDVAHRCQAQTMAASQILFNGSIHHRRLNYSLCCDNQVPSASASYYHCRISFSSGESSFIPPPLRFSSAPAAHLIFNWGAQLCIFKHVWQLFHPGTKRTEKWLFCVDVKIIRRLCFS